MNKYLLASILFVVLYSFISFLNNYPTYYAAQNAPVDFVYSGHAAWFDPWDLNVYLSAIKSGQRSGLLLKNLYTTNDNKQIIMYPVYTISGMLFPRGDIFQLYYFLQFVVILILIASILYCSFIFLGDIMLSFLTVLLVALSRGYGWLYLNIFQSPDLFVTGFSFRSSFQRPHEGIGVVLYILAFTFLYTFLRTKRWKNFILSLSFNILLIFFYPYYYVNYLLIFFVFTIFTRKPIKEIFSLSLSTIILATLSIIYFVSMSHSGFSSSLAEKQPIVSPIGLFTGYGLYLPVFIYQLFKLRNSKERHITIFLSLWVIVSLLLSYIPLGFSRFYLRGLYLPMIMVTLIAFRDFVHREKITRGVIVTLVVVFIISTIPSTFYIYYKRVNETNRANYINIWYYLPKDYFEAFEFLDKLPNDGVLSDYWVGNHIPVYTNKSVFLGHLIQSPNAQERARQVRDFFSNTFQPSEAKSFLVNNHINYIFYGIEEKRYGILNYNFIEPLFTNKNVTILKVLDSN